MSDGEYDWVVGEEVVVSSGSYSRYYEIAKIDRLTATQVLVGMQRFARKNGRAVGRGNGWIVRGAERVAEVRMKEKRRAVTLLVERGPYILTRESIHRMRKIAEQAEAFLREAGEWESAP